MGASVVVGSSRVGGLAVLLAVVVAGSLAAGASKVTLYSDMGCMGDTHSIVKCGYCQNLILYGGYRFFYSDGQPLKFYSRYNCADEPGILLSESATSCGGLKFYRSVRLFCNSAEAGAGAGAAAEDY